VDIARGVADLHREGVVHRNVKPSNVLFRATNTPGEPVLLIADPAVSRDVAHGLRLTMPVGTPGYMAPEQNDPERAIDKRADIYGIGATIYHAVTGRRPAERPVPPSALRQGLPAGADAVILRALACDPDKRWANADALAAALDDLGAAAVDRWPPSAQTQTPVRMSLTCRWSLLLAALVAVVSVGTVVTIQFGPSFASGGVQASPALTSQSTASRSATPVPSTSDTSQSNGSSPEPPSPPPPTTTTTQYTVTTTTSDAPPAQPVPVTPTCRHSKGDGVVVSATALRTTTSPSETIGSIQLCRDASHFYWAYLVRYKPLPTGQWANGTLDRLVDGHFDARFSCAATKIGAKGVITDGQSECWSPKVSGTDTSLIFYAFAKQCDGTYDEQNRCTAEGSTARKR
jgi:serine/threonine protein kinase